MGPMMGGWAGGAMALFGLAFLVLLVLLAVFVLARLGTGRPAIPERRQTPEELLRERYARGKIGWPEYRETLVNLLKDRYTRGELELPQYEERLGRLLEDGAPRRGEARARVEPQPPEGPVDR